jgi:nucleotide-binding universal stress UspA family protein
MYGNVLIPVDGSDCSTAGLLEVPKLAVGQARQIRLLHVVDELHWNAKFDPGCIGGVMIESIRESGRKILREAHSVLSQHGLVSECILVDAHGARTADMILAQAREWPADLIIMGTHGRRGLIRLALGSDAEEVVRRSPVPVLLVRATSAARHPPAESLAAPATR